MLYKVKLGVHFPLDPVSRSAIGNTLYGHEREVEDLVRPFVSVKYVDTYMLRSSDCYGYEGDTVFDPRFAPTHEAKNRYADIKTFIECRYPRAIVSVVFTPTAQPLSFGPTQLPELPPYNE
jgi:hypothetical protein